MSEKPRFSKRHLMTGLMVLAALSIVVIGVPWPWSDHSDAPVRGVPAPADTTPRAVSGDEFEGASVRSSERVTLASPGDPVAQQPTSADGLVTVIVRDELDKEVPEALVLLIDGAQHNELGRTDSEGIIRAAPASLVADEIAAVSPGFATATLPLRGEVPPVIVLELLSGFDVSGVVTTQDGFPVGAGVRVLLWSQEDVADQQDALRACSGDPSAWTAVSDDQGRFTIRGLALQQRYSAIAGGAGYLTPQILRRVDADSTDVRIVVERAFATWVRFRDQDGVPIRTAPTLYGRRYGTARSEDRSIHRVGGTVAAVALTGLGAELLRSQTFTDRLYVFTASTTAESVGPFRLSLTYPGYDPVDASFSAPLLSSPVAETVVTFKSRSTITSELEVRFLGVPDPEVAVHEAEPFGAIALTNEQGERFQFAVGDPRGLQVIPGLPPGRYSAEFETLSATWRAPGDPEAGIAVDVGPAQGALEFDLSELGTVRVDVLRDSGRALVSRASIACHRDDGRELPVRVFKRAPYVLSGLPAGSYSIYLDQPRLGERTTPSVQARAVSVAVVPGELVSVELRVPD